MKQVKITVGLPSKGRLYDGTKQLLKKQILNIRKSERTLVTNIEHSDKLLLRLTFLRPKDIVKLVSIGTIDFGITSEDSVLESLYKVSTLSRLGFGNCRISICVPKQSKIKSLTKLNGKTIATSYPKVTKRFLKNIGLDCKILTLTGSVEAAPLIGLSDAICEIVGSGETLKANGLIELTQIQPFEAVLIGNKKINEKKYHLLKGLL